MCELVESLGWKHTGTWCNREFYSIGKYFQLVEHNGCWFISKGEDAYYIEGADENMVREFTAIATLITGNLKNPDDPTFGDWHENLDKLREFYKKYEDWWPDNEDEEYDV